MSKERFHILIRQYIDDQLDQQGMAELQDLLRSGDHEAELRTVYDEVYDNPYQEHDLAPDRVRKILYAIHADGIKATPSDGTKLIPMWQRIGRSWKTAAAAVLVLAGGYFVAKQFIRTETPIAKVTTRPPLPLHSDKAILTLAGGQQVVLDDTTNGNIANEQGVSVVKLNNGQLSYIIKGSPVSAGQYNVLTTPRGGQYVVQLPDGSKVYLNSASSLRYPTVFNGPARTVTLEGEAYFEVAKNSRQPFTVQTGDIKVAVLGTAFNCMAYPDEDAIKTTLVNGSVKLQDHHTAQLLKPGEQGSLGKGDDRFVISQPDLEDVLAWKNGEFRFSGEKIQVIMRQVARWYDVDVEYQGTPPANKFNGDILKGKDGGSLLDMLETTRAVHFKVEGRKIIVIPGPGENNPDK